MTQSILVVEDDQALRSLLVEQLMEKGYEVKSADSVKSAKNLARDSHYNLAIIDIGLPDGDGFTLARSLKEENDSPFLFLTAMNSPEFRLEGYELGAIDYVPKPFHMKELTLRIERAIGETSKTAETLSTEHFTLLPDERTLKIHDTNESHLLTGREFDLLYHLVKDSPKIISREAVFSSIWMCESGSRRVVDNVILKLRQYLGSELAGSLQSVRGAGYQWVESNSK